MKYSKKLIVAASSLGVIGAAGIGATTIAATSSTSDYPPIVRKLASTFNLDPAKVNEVFKQERKENDQNRGDRLKSHLDQAVKDGKLSQSQADMLLAKIKSLRDQLKSDNKHERRQNRHDFKSQLENWAKDNGINNLDEILPAPGPRGMHHRVMIHNDH